jgi:hypothetical protein
LLCRPCLDWSERRPHLAGVIGASLCRLSFAQGWLRRHEQAAGDTVQARLIARRAIVITPKGARIFREQFGAELG